MNILENVFWHCKDFSTGGSIKTLTDVKFPQIYMHYISLDCKLFGDKKNIGIIILCMPDAKRSLKTILSKIFEEKVDYTKVDQFSIPSFKNYDVSRK